MNMVTKEEDEVQEIEDPDSVQAKLESTLQGLLHSLLELGICASDVQPQGMAGNGANDIGNQPAGLVGQKANDIIRHLEKLYNLKDDTQDILIPMEVINRVDRGRNPDLFTQEFTDRTAGENMYTNGILDAVQGYQHHLASELSRTVPELAAAIKSMDLPVPINRTSPSPNEPKASTTTAIDGER